MKVSSSSYLTLPLLGSDPEKNPIWSTRPLVSIPPDPSDSFHLLVSGDRIDLLSWRYYGTVDYWWAISDVNNLSFPLSLPTGESLRIPELNRLKKVINDARLR